MVVSDLGPCWCAKIPLFYHAGCSDHSSGGTNAPQHVALDGLRHAVLPWQSAGASAIDPDCMSKHAFRMMAARTPRCV